MTPRFAKAVDPIFMQAIRLLERVEQGAQPDLHEERAAIVAHFQSAETALANSEEWRLAKYSISAWIDEVMVFAAWADWENHPLEYEHFGTSEAQTAFFDRAQQALKLTGKDALEVFYICVVLGFRGIYRSDAADAAVLKQHGLPVDIKTWAKQIRGNLQLRQGRPPIPMRPQPGESARPLKSKFQFLANGLTTLILLLVLACVGWSYLSSAKSSKSKSGSSAAKTKANGTP